jgi:ABC-type amino acid transport substrate-binding protein
VYFYGPTLGYYAARNDDLTVLHTERVIEYGCRMILRSEDSDLQGRINEALASMHEDGTLSELARKYITELTPDMQVAGRNMPRFPDAPTYIVGLTGDIPPLDYAAVDGRAAGFNAELLAVLSERLEVNFEIYVMPVPSRYPALASNRIDLFFLHMEMNPDTIDLSFVPTIERTENPRNDFIYTDFYFTHFETGFLVLR